MFSTFLCPKTYIPTSIRNILIENHKKKSQYNESTSVLSINITWLRKDQKEPVLIMRNSCVTTLKFVFNQKSSRPKRFLFTDRYLIKTKRKTISPLTIVNFILESCFEGKNDLERQRFRFKI